MALDYSRTQTQALLGEVERLRGQPHVSENAVSGFALTLNPATKGVDVAFGIENESGLKSVTLLRNSSADPATAVVLQTWSASEAGYAWSDTDAKLQTFAAASYWLKLEPLNITGQSVTIGPETIVLNPALIPPANALAISASHGAAANGIVPVTINVLPVTIGTFSVKVYVSGYQGNAGFVALAQDTSSPIQFNLDATGETVTFKAIAVSSGGAEATGGPTCTLTLNSSATVPAKVVEIIAVQQPTGVQIQWLANRESYVTGYKVYRATLGAGFGAATLLTTVSSTGVASYAYLDAAQAFSGVFEWYIVATSAVGDASPSTAVSVTLATLGGAGKNLLSNPGFESNNMGTPYQTDLAGSAPVGDGWFVFDKPSTFWAVMLEQDGSARSGLNNLLIRLLSGISIPNSATFWDLQVASAQKIPVAVGDVLRVSGWTAWAGAALPAGVTIIQRIGLNIYGSDGTQLGSLSADMTSTSSGYRVQQGSLVIPATLGGGVPAYVRAICAAFVQNLSGATWNTGATLYADMRWEDLKAVVQSTAFDLTPISTSYTKVSGSAPSAAAGGSANTDTVTVPATTWQFGDGQVSYNSGTISPLNDSTTYYLYADDPGYAGGTVSYQASTDPAVLNAGNGRIPFGKVTTPAFGAGPITGEIGGNGPAAFLARV